MDFKLTYDFRTALRANLLEELPFPLILRFHLPNLDRFFVCSINPVVNEGGNSNHCKLIGRYFVNKMPEVVLNRGEVIP